MSVIFTYRHRNLFSDEWTGSSARTVVAQDSVRRRKRGHKKGQRRAQSSVYDGGEGHVLMEVRVLRVSVPAAH